VSFADDVHPTGALGPCGTYESLGACVHLRGLWRGRYYLDPAGGEHRVERGGDDDVGVVQQPVVDGGGGEGFGHD
jgi:hypothetical protein